MRNPTQPAASGQAEKTVSLSVTFRIGRLTPRGVRQHFIESLRVAIARALKVGRIDRAVAEELWRALPSTREPRR